MDKAQELIKSIVFEERETLEETIKAQLDMIKDVEDSLKSLKQEYRDEAIAHGFAHNTPRARAIVPNLAWWQAKHPRTWNKYIKYSASNIFTWNKK